MHCRVTVTRCSMAYVVKCSLMSEEDTSTFAPVETMQEPLQMLHGRFRVLKRQADQQYLAVSSLPFIWNQSFQGEDTYII